jgi:hypothetical protein
LSLRTGGTFAERLYTVFDILKTPGSDADSYKKWLRSGWLNVSRLANLLAMALRN